MIAHGLLRLALLLAVTSGAVVLVAWLVASHWDKFVRADPAGDVFYFAGAAVGVLAVLGGTGGGRVAYRYGGFGSDVGASRQSAVNLSFFLGLLAAFLFGVGIVLDLL